MEQTLAAGFEEENFRPARVVVYPHPEERGAWAISIMFGDWEFAEVTKLPLTREEAGRVGSNLARTIPEASLEITD